MSRDLERRAVAFVGDSDVGKTALLEQLISALEARGLAVGAVKHASHGFDADRPGKDSHRLYASGAQAVALIGGSQIATFTRRDPEQRESLREALAALPTDLDAVLVEGFGWETIARVVLVRPGRSARREHLEAGPVLQVVEVPEANRGERPVFPADLLGALADQISETLRGWLAPHSGRRAAVAVARTLCA